MMIGHPYALIHSPAPANSAATPIAPVLIGLAAPSAAVVSALPPDVGLGSSAAAVGPAPRGDVGVGIPEVSPRLETLLAPEKAGACTEAVGSGAASVLFGFRTLSMT